MTPALAATPRPRSQTIGEETLATTKPADTLRGDPPHRGLEIADVLRAHGDAYRETHPLSPEQARVMAHLTACRTAALGGHVDACDSCGYQRVSYNSCRDRHCPKCQSLKKAEWLERRMERLLPVEHFHVVFTLPSELNPLALQNKRAVYSLLFRAASETLLQLAADPKHLGAQAGFTAILHTWGQNLLFHPHLHCVVTGGGLATEGTSGSRGAGDSNGERWVSTRQGFFLPVKVLSRLYRGKFLDFLRKAYDAGELSFQGGTASLADPREFRHLMDTLYQKEWVVYAKPPFGGVEQVFRYLGRYTHRIAISNHRLVAMRNGKVSFRYRDSAGGDKRKVMTLEATEFIRRFLLHVLPKRFVRIRHYGLLAGRNVGTKLERCRRLLTGDSSAGEASPAAEPEPKKSWVERMLELTGVDPTACPHCGEGRLIRQPFEAGFEPVERVVWRIDSS